MEGKRTLITIHAAEHGVDVRSLVDQEPTDEAIDETVDRLAATGSIDYARETARAFIDDGKAKLRVLPDNPSRRRLADIADYFIERDR